MRNLIWLKYHIMMMFSFSIRRRTLYSILYDISLMKCDLKKLEECLLEMEIFIMINDVPQSFVRSFEGNVRMKQFLQEVIRRSERKVKTIKLTKTNIYDNQFGNPC